jgi:hypothetical protein
LSESRITKEMTVLEQASPPAKAVPSAVPEFEPRSIEPSVVVAIVMDFVGATLPQFDQLLESMRLSPDGPGMIGSLFQWSRHTPDGVRVTEVWQSYTHFEVFLRKEVEPRLSEVGMREPEITTYEVHSYLTQGPNPAQQAVESGSERRAVRRSHAHGESTPAGRR